MPRDTLPSSTMSPFNLPLVRQKLAARPPRLIDEAPSPSPSPRAAVAAILRSRHEGPEILLIRRAERAGDPWSGQMAFPGGRASIGDPDLVSTAIRETHEEVGLDLRERSELLGRLDDLPAIARAKPTGLVIAPFVFGLRQEGSLALNHEVAEALWTPLEPLVSGAAATTFPYRFESQTLSLPALQVGPHVVWGLTYQMLRMLFEAIRAG